MVSRAATKGTRLDASESSVMTSASSIAAKSRPRRELITGPNTAIATWPATTASTRSSSIAAAPVSAAAAPDCAPSATRAPNATRLNASDTSAKAAPSMA